ncbi:MAG: hypothetical protein HYS13_25655 [Planctomycetia bacterium]|nr:hypothetical protein [Planctomycetia bacterium]
MQPITTTPTPALPNDAPLVAEALAVAPPADSNGGATDAVVVAQPLLPPPNRIGAPTAPPAASSPVAHPVIRRDPVAAALAWCFWAVISMFGAATMIVVLAVLATLPILQFLSLGYLLAVSARIARSGRIRDGFIGLRAAGVLGILGFFLYLYWLALKFAASMADSARIIAPGSGAAAGWAGGVMIGLWVLGGVVLLASLVAFLIWPRFYVFLRDGVWTFFTRRLWYYAWLGLRGFVGGLVWLAVPVSMLVVASLIPGADRPIAIFASTMLRLVGSFLLMVVVIYVPFLQGRMAAANRFAEVFDILSVRAEFRRAPIAFWLAVVTTLLFALPLYLLKIEVVPRDAAALPALFFVVFIFPARVLTGWAMARARKRERPRHFVFRQLARLGMIPVAAFYALIVFFTQYTGWHGVWGMYEQHAFLLPVPFLGV